MLPASAPLRLFRSTPAVLRRTASFSISAFRRGDTSNPGEQLPFPDICTLLMLLTADGYPIERTPEPLPYFIYRTVNNNLPVYQEYKAGGNKLQTRIRRVEGNLQFLKNQIEEAFQMEKGGVTVNPLTKHIIVKGRRRDEIIRLLSDLRF